MYGKGRPRPIARGVSAGKMLVSNTRSSCSRSSGLARSGEMIRIPCSASAGRSSRSKHRASALALGEHPLADRVDLVVRAHAVGAARIDPRLELVVKVRHPHHEELVQVRLPDRAELDPLQQRHRGVLGELQDAIVEVEPGELAVEVQRGVLEIRRRRRLGGGCAALLHRLRRGGHPPASDLSHSPYSHASAAILRRLFAAWAGANPPAVLASAPGRCPPLAVGRSVAPRPRAAAAWSSAAALAARDAASRSLRSAASSSRRACSARLAALRRSFTARR